jgi:hypothetical protein
VVWNPSSGTSEQRSQGAAALTPSSYGSGATLGNSLGTRYRPAMNVAEVMALAKHEVLLLALGKRSRLYSSWAVWQHGLDTLPRPPAPTPPAAAHRATADAEPAPATVPPRGQPEGAW